MNGRARRKTFDKFFSSSNFTFLGLSQETYQRYLEILFTIGNFHKKSNLYVEDLAAHLERSARQTTRDLLTLIRMGAPISFASRSICRTGSFAALPAISVESDWPGLLLQRATQLESQFAKPLARLAAKILELHEGLSFIHNKRSIGSQKFVVRLLEIDNLLGSEGLPTKEQLQTLLHTNRKAIERNFDTMRSLGADITYDSKTNGYAYESPFYITAFIVAEDEVNALTVAMTGLSPERAAPFQELYDAIRNAADIARYNACYLSAHTLSAEIRAALAAGAAREAGWGHTVWDSPADRAKAATSRSVAFSPASRRRWSASTVAKRTTDATKGVSDCVDVACQAVSLGSLQMEQRSAFGG